MFRPDAASGRSGGASGTLSSSAAAARISLRCGRAMTARCRSATTRTGNTTAQTTAPAASFSSTTASATSSARVSWSTASATIAARVGLPSRRRPPQAFTTSHRRSTCNTNTARSSSAGRTQTPIQMRSQFCGSSQLSGKRRPSRSCRRSGRRRSGRCYACGGDPKRSRRSCASCPSSVSTKYLATYWQSNPSHRTCLDL
mmetsp:Transcript_6221/g.13537  ORF Transcript_6221/g.13537 Transcript_6221/m.13537 type:complete len:200 (-) Transcript_6221:169-768(-)